VFHVLIGINLLREGLDLPEVSLVAILDADKEGFLRAERSLIQTIGRAARNSDGYVIMYGDKITDSMHKAITETNRRRTIQMAYNEANGITPETIRKKIRDVIEATKVAEADQDYLSGKNVEKLSKKDRAAVIERLEQEMKEAAKNLQFERAAELRDAMLEIKATL
jgi:excinuclease ABC subunit B